MNRREKLLAIGVGLVGAVYGLGAGYERWYEQPLEAARAQTARLHKEIADRRRQMRHVRDDARQLARWREQSLPANLQLARSAYQAWLLELVRRSGWEAAQVDPSEPASRRGLYQALSFSLRGRAAPGQLVEFLYEFYRADHLQQIRSLSLAPQGKQELLEVALSVEALALPEAAQADRLSPRRSDRLALGSPADYDLIARRNFFAPGGERLDLADHVFLTAITADGGQREAWFTLRSSGEVRRLRAGERLGLARHQAQVMRVGGADVLLALDGQLWLLTLGENLAQATVVPAEISRLLGGAP